MKVVALDHKNNTARARIETWPKRVRRLYWSNSNKIQERVAAPNTPPETFLFLHRNMSAADSKKTTCKHQIKIVLLNLYTIPSNKTNLQS